MHPSDIINSETVKLVFKYLLNANESDVILKFEFDFIEIVVTLCRCA